MSAIESVDVAGYLVPIRHPEPDGTFQWDSTTVVGEAQVAERSRVLR